MATTFNDAMQQTAGYLLQAARRRLQRETNLCRPSVMLRAAVQIGEGGQYTASYSGVFACGDSPEEAYEAFDQLWQKGN